MDLFAEAIRSAFLPCSFALLVPALVLIGLRSSNDRNRTLAVFGLWAALFAWLPFVGLATGRGGIVGGAAFIGGIWLLGWRSESWASLAGASLLGGFAGATWIPCVGPEFGSILVRGLDSPISAVAPMTIYIIGVLTPIIVIVAAIEFVPSIRHLADHERTITVARVTGFILGLIVLLGQYGRLMSELARRSAF